MKQTMAILLTALSIPAVWAGPSGRRGGREISVTRSTDSGRPVGRLHFSSRSAARRHAAGTEAAAPPPAPGVVQIKTLEGQVFAYFVVTSTIPAGSTVGGFLTIDNGSEIDFDTVTFNSDSLPGDYLVLPGFSNLGDLWPVGVATYTVDVTTNNALTETNGEFLSGESFAFTDLANFPPVITGTSQRIDSNKNMILVINGIFLTDAPLVVLETAVAPAGAITRVSGAEIDVNLSQVPGLDLTTLNEYLLTVGQAGFADTLVYRYVPGQAGTFNPAPKQ